MFNQYEETIETNEQTTLTNWNALTFEEIKDEVDEDVEKWIPEVNDFRIGVYTSTIQGTGKVDGLTFHIFEDQEGNRFSLLGCTVLDKKLSKIEYGTIVKIIYKGYATSEKGRDYKNYEVLKATG